MPLFISPRTGNFTARRVSFGALGDSYYEYLLKLWVLKGKGPDNEVYRAMWEKVRARASAARGGGEHVVAAVRAAAAPKHARRHAFLPAQSMDDMIDKLVFVSADNLTYIAEFERYGGTGGTRGWRGGRERGLPRVGRAGAAACQAASSSAPPPPKGACSSLPHAPHCPMHSLTTRHPSPPPPPSLQLRREAQVRPPGLLCAGHAGAGRAQRRGHGRQGGAVRGAGGRADPHVLADVPPYAHGCAPGSGAGGRGVMLVC